MSRLWPQGLIARSMLVVGGILALQLASSLAAYALIDRDALREDHARRVAELLVVSRRVHALAATGGPDAGQVMTSRYLQAEVSASPPRLHRGDARADVVRKAMIAWEPELATVNLALWTAAGPGGRPDLVGAMRLNDGGWLSFRSRDPSRAWPAALRMGLATTVVCLGSLAFAAYVLRRLGQPLRALTQAARAFGAGPHGPVKVEGSTELKELAVAFNEMQDRIAGLIQDQAQAMEAISHDMRTPLARLQLAAEFAEPEETRSQLIEDVKELDGMLSSLSAYLRAQHEVSPAEPVDLPELIRTVLRPWRDSATYEGPDRLEVTAHRTALEGALRRVVDNAVRYGGHARVVLTGDGDREIWVSDEGAGMPADQLARLYEPFYRGDAARARLTPGFGLGIPTAVRLLRRHGGDLRITNGPDRGLLIRLAPPLIAPSTRGR